MFLSNFLKFLAPLPFQNPAYATELLHPISEFRPIIYLLMNETRVQVFHTSDQILLLICGHFLNFFLIREFYF